MQPVRPDAIDRFAVEITVSRYIADKRLLRFIDSQPRSCLLDSTRDSSSYSESLLDTALLDTEFSLDSNLLLKMIYSTVSICV